MRENIFMPLLERLAAAPHRSVAGVPYGEWFHLYIRSLRSSPNGAADPNSCAALDAAFLSSVVSRSWKDVILPPAVAPEAAWWSGSLGRHAPRELVTAPFLADPMLGGRCVAAWTNALRRTAGSAAPSPNAPTSAAAAPSGGTAREACAAVCVIVPFSALLELRGAAHAPQPAVSLQERTARLSALHALLPLLELQAHTNSGDAAAPVRLVVCGPSEEFAAIAQIARARGATAEPVRGPFTLARLCEDAMARTAYLAHGMGPLTVLVPQSQHAAMRRFGVRALSEHSVAAVGSGGAAALHRRAAESCGRLVRRMAAREENLRQTFTP